MTFNEKFNLEWNDFEENVASNFGELRNEKDFCDVTLSCEDNKSVEAHKVVLSTCSSVFKSILKENKHSHPMIYLRGITSTHLNLLVDFIYNGEVNVFQDYLDSFLRTAEEFKIQGFSRPPFSVDKQ